MLRLQEIIREIREIESSLGSEIEKASHGKQVGEISTRSDGRKYKKVSSTGNSKVDWVLITKDKKPKKEETVGSKAKGQGDLKEHAKASSETSLNNAIKQSPDPKVREAAQIEIERRQKEEKPQEKPGVNKSKT